MSSNRLSRRGFLGRATALGMGFSVGALPIVRSTDARSDTQGPQRKRALRIAHLTDVHVKPELGAAEGMAAALRHAQAQQDPPQLVLTGGDAIMDALAVSAEKTGQLWKLWHRVLVGECSLPVEHCIGNHDVWGWDKARSKTTGDEPGWGKQRALDEFGMPNRYRSFDRGGWHFVILDSIFPDPQNVYIGKLDDEQFDWLARDLNGVDANTPVVVVSHIPILTVAFIEYSKSFTADPLRARGVAHTDAKRIVDLFKQHPNVKLCLSGHLHLTERIEYAGVTYICSGAVSGSWWRGNNHQTEEGYALVDLYDDSSFESQYVAYGWKPR